MFFTRSSLVCRLRRAYVCKNTRLLACNTHTPGTSSKQLQRHAGIEGRHADGQRLHLKDPKRGCTKSLYGEAQSGFTEHTWTAFAQCRRSSLLRSLGSWHHSLSQLVGHKPVGQCHCPCDKPVTVPAMPCPVTSLWVHAVSCHTSLLAHVLHVNLTLGTRAWKSASASHTCTNSPHSHGSTIHASG